MNYYYYYFFNFFLYLRDKLFFFMIFENNFFLIYIYNNIYIYISLNDKKVNSRGENSAHALLQSLRIFAGSCEILQTYENSQIAKFF